MKTRYRALTKRGVWIIISSKKPIRNVKMASAIAKEEIVEVKLGTLIDQFKLWK